MAHENKRLEHKVEIFKDSNNVCECITTIFSFSKSKEKIYQVISVVLIKLAKKDDRFWWGAAKVRLINAKSSSYLK